MSHQLYIMLAASLITGCVDNPLKARVDPIDSTHLTEIQLHPEGAGIGEVLPLPDGSTLFSTALVSDSTPLGIYRVDREYQVQQTLGNRAEKSESDSPVEFHRILSLCRSNGVVFALGATKDETRYLLRSPNWGMSWSEPEPLPFAVPDRVHCAGEVLYLSAHGFAAESLDAGARWHRIYPPMPHDGGTRWATNQNAIVKLGENFAFRTDREWDTPYLGRTIVAVDRHLEYGVEERGDELYQVVKLELPKPVRIGKPFFAGDAVAIRVSFERITVATLRFEPSSPNQTGYYLLDSDDRGQNWTVSLAPARLDGIGYTPVLALTRRQDIFVSYDGRARFYEWPRD